MRRLLTAVLSACCLSVASSQTSLELLELLELGPTDWGSFLCEVGCTCVAKPGQVDRCARYRTLKKVNPGDLVVVENDDPAACSQSVEDNLVSLSEYYGNRAEIGLPTQDMANKVNSLSVPKLDSLSYSRLLDASQAMDASKALDTRIEIAINRISALTGDARAFANVAAVTASWESASVASQRLIRRAIGAGMALSLARPWPTIGEFAPKVWRIRVCERLKPDVVAQLDKRIQSEGSDDAWNFAFYEDLVALLKPFNVDQLPPDSKNAAFESIASPFFAEPADRVKTRSDKTLPTSYDVRAFKDAVEKTGKSLAPYLIDRQTRSKARRDELLGSYDVETANISGLREGLKSRADALSAIKERINSAMALQSTTASDITKIIAFISDETKALATLNLDRERLKTDRAIIASEVNVKRTEMIAAQRALDAIILNCGGISYENCKDANLRREYDRLRYLANVALSSARRAYTDVIGKSVQSTQKILTMETSIDQRRATLALKKEELVSHRKSLDDINASVATLGTQAREKEANVLSLANSMSKLDGAIVSLELLRPQ